MKMGDQSLTPPRSPSSFSPNNGGNSVHPLMTLEFSKQLTDCGVNVSQLDLDPNQTSADFFDYLNDVLTSHNCSTGGPVQPWEPTTSASPHVLLIVYFAAIMVLSLAVNTCVIGTICRVRKLRTITNCFVLSLAFADLLMASVVVPLKIKELYNQKTETSPFLDTLFPILGVASLLNLCAVTLDRYFTITSPLTYEAKVSSLQTGIVIASIWVISTTQEMIRFAVNKDEYLFQVIRFVIVFSVPFICVMFVNAKIYLIARGHARQIRASVPDQNTDSNRRNFYKKMKTAQVIGLLVGTFIFTWLPYFIITIYEHINEQRHVSTGVSLYKPTPALEVGKIVCAALACSTALFNPLLYGFLRKEVRSAIIKCVKCENINQLDFNTNTEITARRIENTTRK
ncbi:5-hydroxytryptamine receptor 4-like [Actinia tenebrosa]|uniref:5-hydroxytryptamine receptor 4-like n=1 Tax=Actinia tenebrosa TaxID=6105 RepID=A0A6P8H911_ACTTE|nr:5-hydroxytryptamine receptor 4-like [Actinia tenebrosa]